jgi:hypothetical protein
MRVIRNILSRGDLAADVLNTLADWNETKGYTSEDLMTFETKKNLRIVGGVPCYCVTAETESWYGMKTEQKWHDKYPNAMKRWEASPLLNSLHSRLGYNWDVISPNTNNYLKAF